MKGYMLKCDACGWEWDVTIAEAARFDRLYLQCPACKGRRAKTARLFDDDRALDGPAVLDRLGLTYDAVLQLVGGSSDPQGRLGECLLENGDGLENGGPLTPQDARAVAETAWQWAKDRAAPPVWELAKMSAHGREAVGLLSKWTATLARVRLLPRELQASLARAVNALLEANGDKSQALARFHKRMVAAKSAPAIIGALEALAADLGAKP
jgi:hypothetical protein